MPDARRETSAFLRARRIYAVGRLRNEARSQFASLVTSGVSQRAVAAAALRHIRAVRPFMSFSGCGA